MMKTLAQWQKQINDSGRIMSEVTLSEAQQILDCIALEWMQGKAKLTHPTALQSISFALKTAQERKKDYKTIGAELGAIGGSKTSEAKTKAVQENGKKGGRPKKDGTTPSEEDKELFAAEYDEALKSHFIERKLENETEIN